MSRPLRIAYQGAWYHIMNRGLAHNPIYLNDRHRQTFLDLLFEIHHRYHAEIHAYCLMDNHYHLLIRTPLANISRIMRHLDGIYTQRFNNSVKRDGPLFRGRYKSILIEADVYLLRLSRYIHLNPVKANIVKKAEHFSWSSYQAYLSGISPQWLNTNYILNYFGKHLQRTKYKEFVEEGIDKEIDQFYKKLKSAPILGTTAFIQKVTEIHLQDQHKIVEIPEHKLLLLKEPLDIAKIVDCVATFYRISMQDIKLVRERRHKQPRAIAIYLAHIISQYSFPQISSYFPKITTAGVSRACQRLQRKMINHEEVRQDVEKLAERIMSIVQT